MTEEERGFEELGDPDTILRTRTRGVGALTFLLIVVVVVSFAWYALVTIPRFGQTIRAEAPAVEPTYNPNRPDGVPVVSDPIQGS